MNNIAPQLRSIQPILPVADIRATVAWWTERLGFPDSWLWGEPPVHAGVRWGEMQVQFSLDAAAAASHQAGITVNLNITDIENVYELHCRRGLEVVEPLETKTWGMTEYILRDINGYLVRIGMPKSWRKPSTDFPDNIAFEMRPPTQAEHMALLVAVGWVSAEDVVGQSRRPGAAVCGVTAIDRETGEAVGCTMLCFDGDNFYYVKDVAVRPEWQSRRIGEGLVERLCTWADTNLPDGVTIGLFTGEALAPFYGRFGFQPAYGMLRIVRRRESNPCSE